MVIVVVISGMNHSERERLARFRFLRKEVSCSSVQALTASAVFVYPQRIQAELNAATARKTRGARLTAGNCSLFVLSMIKKSRLIRIR